MTSFKDVCDELAPRLVWEAQAKGALPLSEDEAAVLAALDDAPAIPDKLASAIDIPRGRIALALVASRGPRLGATYPLGLHPERDGSPSAARAPVTLCRTHSDLQQEGGQRYRLWLNT